MLAIEGLSVRYGDFVALDTVDLEIADREIVCVLGPSGSGKSTLLRAVAGLAPEARGRVSFDGVDVTATPPHRRGFGLMFQDHALFQHRDVIGNVGFGLRMQRVPRAEVDARARATLELVGLRGFEHRRVSDLSGGEQQRVALARALAPAPKLLMLDEPLGALDRTLRDRLVVELRELFVQLGLAILFVTHDHDEAFSLADRVVVMHAGRVEQVGPPAAVWRRPANAFVAEFLGWNVTEGLGGGRVAVRPDGLRLDPFEPGSGAVRATVSSRTFRRDHFLVQVELADGSTLQVAVGIDSRLPDVGATVRITAGPGATIPLP
jgi:thiamine transport system ATP-binding protein